MTTRKKYVNFNITYSLKKSKTRIMISEILCITDNFLKNCIEYTNENKTDVIDNNVFVGKNCSENDFLIRKMLENPKKYRRNIIYISAENTSLDTYVTDILTATKFELMMQYKHYTEYQILRLIDAELEILE